MYSEHPTDLLPSPGGGGTAGGRPADSSFSSERARQLVKAQQSCRFFREAAGRPVKARSDSSFSSELGTGLPTCGRSRRTVGRPRPVLDNRWKSGGTRSRAQEVRLTRVGQAQTSQGVRPSTGRPVKVRGGCPVAQEVRLRQWMGP